MSLLKSGQISNCCQPNALMTLKEYIMDYASEETKKNAEALIEKEIENVTNPKVRDIAKERLKMIEEGKRDFRF